MRVVQWGNRPGRRGRDSERGGRRGECAVNRKKILNRGNEPKRLFRINDLVFQVCQNELV
jgi:hypothetical protein